MKKILAGACLIFAFAPGAFSIEPAQWQYRQPVTLAKSGPARISVPLGTLDRAQADLRDLRILGPDGGELPYAILDVPTERPPRKISGVTLAPRSFSATMDGDTTVVLIDSGTNKPIDSVQLNIADRTDYTKPARVEVSDDGKNWTLIAQGVPLFRRERGEFSLVQNDIPVGARTERHIRVTISNQGLGDAPIAIHGAKIFAVDEIAARAGIPDEETPVTISNVKQDAGTTILTLDLGAANVSLSQLHFDIADTLFMRRIYLSTTPANADGMRVMLTDSPIYCIKDVDGTPMTSNTTLEFGGRPVSTRTVEVSIINDDSPPLRILGVSAKRRPVLIAFNPPAPGVFTLLSGNPQAAAPRYDLAAFSEKLSQLPLAKITAGAVASTPGYRAPGPARNSGQFVNNALFWLALAVVVIVLLAVVAKLLPKPKS